MHESNYHPRNTQCAVTSNTSALMCAATLAAKPCDPPPRHKNTISDRVTGKSNLMSRGGERTESQRKTQVQATTRRSACAEFFLTNSCRACVNRDSHQQPDGPLIGSKICKYVRKWSGGCFYYVKQLLSSFLSRNMTRSTKFWWSVAWVPCVSLCNSIHYWPWPEMWQVMAESENQVKHNPHQSDP